MNTPNNLLDDFLSAKLVVTPKMVHAEDKISYVMLNDYPTMVTKLNNLISAKLEATYEDVYKQGWKAGMQLGSTR